MKSRLFLICIISIAISCTFAADASTATDPGKEEPVPPSPPSSTTAAPTTTSEPSPAPAPTPDPIPASQPLKFNITDKETVCALFSFTATIRLQAKEEQQENDTIVYLLNSTSLDATSACAANVTTLKLQLNGTADTLTLELNHSGSTYSLSKITLVINQATYATNSIKFTVDDSKAYLCQAESNYKLNSTIEKDAASAHLIFKNLNIDAFRTAVKDNDFRQSVQCEADYPTNDFVPLAVGCALISLVLIVLIAYIVGRRRSKRLAYTSV